jgi:hypothetical protein
MKNHLLKKIRGIAGRGNPSTAVGAPASSGLKLQMRADGPCNVLVPARAGSGLRSEHVYHATADRTLGGLKGGSLALTRCEWISRP